MQLVGPVQISPCRRASTGRCARTSSRDGCIPVTPCRPSASSARSCSASRHAVREALKRLQEAGLVRIAQGGATRVCDWRGHRRPRPAARPGRRGPRPARAATSRAGLELRACVGADAARRCAQRASAALRAEVLACAEALAAEVDLDRRNAAYERLWALVVEGADNIAYRLALNTLNLRPAGPGLRRRPHRGRRAVGRAAVRALAAAVADGDADRAHQTARELLERTIPGA